jgi:hypothetical protein
MSINGPTIDKAIAPADMNRHDRQDMYNAAVDVTSLPGGWNSSRGAAEELHQESQRIAQVTATILASSGRARRMEIQDNAWNTTLRHSLGKVKERADLFEFAKKLDKSEKPAFKQQGNLVQHYLFRRHYSEAYVSNYLRNGLLPKIVRDTFTNFAKLANDMRQLGHNHPSWESGPAQAMLVHHSNTLMELRRFSITRKQLILQMYVYLRDAQAKDFYHESMAEALWTRMATIGSSSPSKGKSEVTNGTTKCGQCGTKSLHQLLDKPGQKNYCPFKDFESQAKAKEAAKWVVSQAQADPSKDVSEIVTEAKQHLG